MFYEGQGDMLVVEKNYCSGSLLTSNKVNEILTTFEHDIKLVVILSCHSERVGEIFSKANVGHVICIKQADEIADEFCIKFAYLFYKILLETESSTICKAYETTLKKLSSEMKNTTLKDEEKKFCIKHNHEGQDCPLFEIKTKKGQVEYKGIVPKLSGLPPTNTGFIGRSKELKNILEKLEKFNIMWIEGKSGIGKSALIQEVARLVYDRDIFEDGVLYISAKD